MTRLLGFLIEGIAVEGQYVLRIVLPDSIRKEAEADLKTLRAKLGRDFTLHSPAEYGVKAANIVELVEFANDFVEVSGWLSIFPSFHHAAELQGPVATIFPDAIPKVFHEFSDVWGHKGNHVEWERCTRELVERADRVITFSNHVRDHQLVRLFDADPSKVFVVPHAAPDLAAALPFVTDRSRTLDSIATAAAMLREHAAERGWDYLRNYPFDQVPYIAVSTQDRVTKNIRLILDSALRLVRQERRDLKIFSTAPLHFGAHWTVLPSTIEHLQAHRDLISVPDLPRPEHAALYHCAAISVHAAIFEGGHAPFPFYESVSVGTPCLVANGPHVEELAAEEPGLSQFAFDPNDADELARLIVRTLDNRDEALRIQRAIYDRLRRRTWSDVSTAYVEAALAGPVVRADLGPTNHNRNRED